MLVESALVLRSLQGSPVHDWGHAFVQTEDNLQSTDPVAAPAFLPVPRAEDVPPHARPWVMSALTGKNNPLPWTLPSLMLALTASIVALEAFATRPEAETGDTVTFVMGSTERDFDERPVHGVVLSSYSIDKTEVTVAQYRQCVRDGNCTAPETGIRETEPCNWEESNRENHPINCVNWEQADRYCRAVGKRLPTEAEWEFAARGRKGRKYPWTSADEPDNQLCWGGEGSDLGKGKPRSTCPVGAYSADTTPEGLQDMAGNVYEWVADWYGPYSSELKVDPRGPTSGSTRVIRGGSWYVIDPSYIRGADRDHEEPSLSFLVVGFRCARGAGK